MRAARSAGSRQPTPCGQKAERDGGQIVLGSPGATPKSNALMPRPRRKPRVRRSPLDAARRKPLPQTMPMIVPAWRRGRGDAELLDALRDPEAQQTVDADARDEQRDGGENASNKLDDARAVFPATISKRGGCPTPAAQVAAATIRRTAGTIPRRTPRSESRAAAGCSR